MAGHIPLRRTPRRRDPAAGRRLRAAARTGAGLARDLPGRVPGSPAVWVAAGAGVAYAAGFASGAVLPQFLLGRARLRPDPVAREPLGRLPGRGRLVEADDGVLLQVEEAGLADAPLTVVLVHGYMLEMASWHFQRRDLADRVRLVLYDHRGHGRSGYGDPSRATIDQLGRDLARVLEETCPDGPVVLAGHSLGGMTVMALAAQRPELFGSRVRGVCLVTTSAGRLSELSFGVPARLAEAVRKAAPLALPAAKEAAPLLEHGRSLVGDVAFVLTRRYSFGNRRVSPALVALVERMLAATPLSVAADFYETFVQHDRTDALPILGRVPTTVVGATKDLMTPVEHSKLLADGTPGARLVEIEGAGHLAMLERPDEVTAALVDLLERVQ